MFDKGNVSVVWYFLESLLIILLNVTFNSCYIPFRDVSCQLHRSSGLCLGTGDTNKVVLILYTSY